MTATRIWKGIELGSTGKTMAARVADDGHSFEYGVIESIGGEPAVRAWASKPDDLYPVIFADDPDLLAKQTYKAGWVASMKSKFGICEMWECTRNRKGGTSEYYSNGPDDYCDDHIKQKVKDIKKDLMRYTGDTDDGSALRLTRPDAATLYEALGFVAHSTIRTDREWSEWYRSMRDRLFTFTGTGEEPVMEPAPSVFQRVLRPLIEFRKAA